jgi:CheY-like chemotaxis protein
MEKRKILVVDDEPDFLKIIKIRLESDGYEVLLSDNGKDALDKIKKDRPDAVLLDVLMPGLDGLEVLRRIRKQYKNLPVFIITAFSNNERFELAKKLNASGFIVKTSDLGDEINNIGSFLRLADNFKKK